MDIKEIDLRRSDFEAMHPVAKLFNFDHEKLTYFGDAYDDAKRLNDLWSTWCACVGLLYLETNTAKAQAVPEGFVLVEKKNTEDWYLDESEGMWFDHDGIDGGLCELDIGEVQAVEHKEYLITESNTLYATKVWNEENQDVDCWTLFKTEEEANKAAAYCKAKFNDEPIEAQEQKG